jgi:toluene monooxygenase system protein D
VKVGPVFMRGELTPALVAALRELNEGLEVIDRGAYVRISAEDGCRLTRTVVERHLGRPFHLPADLERAMASFAGRFVVDEDEARWFTSQPGSSRGGGAGS